MLAVDGERACRHGGGEARVREDQAGDIIGGTERGADVGRALLYRIGGELSEGKSVSASGRRWPRAGGGDGGIADIGEPAVEQGGVFERIDSILEDAEFGFDAAVGVVALRQYALVGAHARLRGPLGLGELIDQGGPVEAGSQTA